MMVMLRAGASVVRAGVPGDRAFAVMAGAMVVGLEVDVAKGQVTMVSSSFALVLNLIHRARCAGPGEHQRERYAKHSNPGLQR
jgi:hypothetical protein